MQNRNPVTAGLFLLINPVKYYSYFYKVLIIMDLNVNIRNFGKISHASLVIRPFTVITGYNSSGKSFITRGLYSILHTLNQDVVSAYLINSLNSLERLVSLIWDGIPRRSAQDEMLLEDFVSKLEGLKHEIAGRLDFLALLKSGDLLKSFVPDVENLEDDVARLGSQLQAGKGTKMKAIGPLFLKLQTRLGEFADSLDDWLSVYTYSLENGLKKAFSENFQVADLPRLLQNPNAPARFGMDDDTAEIQVGTDGGIKFKVSHSLLNELHSLKNVVYLESPVYYKMRNVLRDSRISRMNMLRRGAVNPVPKYFYDLDELLEANLPGVPEDLERIAEKVESLIKGNLAITPNGEIVYQEEGRTPVPLNMASSGISNMGMIALLLRRNVLNKGSFLFIDEPEMNLHTTWQHAMLDVLLDLGRAGVNVVIATHSLDMLHRLEAIVEGSDGRVGEMVSINRLSTEGETLHDKTVLQGIREAKKVLGEPYLKVLQDRLP